MNRTAAVYARVSTDRQKEQDTIASQKAALLEYAQANQFLVPPEWVFTDEGYSGTVLARPGLERLRDLAAEGQIAAVLVYAPDRLSRKYAYQALLTEEFARHGVETIFIKSPTARTPEEALLVQFQGIIAEYERAQIVERTRRGKRHRAKASSVSVMAVAPYGYRYIKKTEHSQGYFAVQESEAEVVRKIFEWYTQEGWSTAAIARHLNQERIPTRSGKAPWRDATIWGMLRNPAYQGRAAYGKHQNCPPQKCTRRTRLNGGIARRKAQRPVPAEQWIHIEVPGLVSSDLFALTQERLAENKRLSPRNTKEPSLLQGLLVCAQCGYAFCRSSSKKGPLRRHYYRCGGAEAYRRYSPTPCSCRTVRVDYLDDLIWREILELLRCPELIGAELERRRAEHLSSDPVRQRKEQLDRELSRSKQQMDKLLDAYQADLLTLEELRERAPELRKRIGALDREKQSLELHAREDQRWKELNQSLESFLRQLNQRVETLTNADKQKIVRLLVKQIDIGTDTVTIHHSIPMGKPGETVPKMRSSHLHQRHQVALSCA